MNREKRWTESASRGSNTGAEMQDHGVVAPGRDILSTMFPGFNWNPALRCGDSYPDDSRPGYGLCTGTSMSAPFVSGILGMVRSLFPTMTAANTRQWLFTTSSKGAAPDTYVGHGAITEEVIPDWEVWTPLFSFQGIGAGKGYFYTTVPQMASAAVEGTLRPKVNTGSNVYTAYGNPLDIGFGMPTYPGTAVAPQVIGYISSRIKQPVNAFSSIDLVPLIRMSRACGASPWPTCTSATSGRVTHAYTNSWYDAMQNFVATRGFRIDGVEGFLWPTRRNCYGGTGKALVRGSTHHSAPSDQSEDYGLFTMQETNSHDFTSLPAAYQHEQTILGYLYEIPICLNPPHPPLPPG